MYAPRLNHTANGSIALPRWQAALSMFRQGLYVPRIICIGDSTTAGFGGSGGSYSGAKAFSYPAQLASALAARGVPASSSSFIGANQTQVATNAYDPRISWTGPFIVSQYNSAGISGFEVDSSAGVFSFNPGIVCDTAEIWHIQQPAGQFTVSADNTVVLTNNYGGSIEMINAVATFSRGQRTIKFTPTVGDFHYLEAIYCRDSQSPSVEVANAGWDAGVIGQLRANNATYACANTLYAMSADLYILNCIINDANSGTDVGAYGDDIGGLIDVLLTRGDVLLVQPQPVSFSSPSTVPGYVKAAYKACRDRRVPVLDIGLSMGTYAQAQAAGYTYDALHPSALGYKVIANKIAALLANA